MRAPSLYTHFDSKNAIHDAMFGQAWAEALEFFEEARTRLPTERRAAIRSVAHTFFDFAVSDLPRHQLMNLRTIPGFEPSTESYAPAVAVLDLARDVFTGHGITAPEDLDLFTALVGGLVDAQHANDPGGTRWQRLVDRAVDMFVDFLDAPAPPTIGPKE